MTQTESALQIEGNPGEHISHFATRLEAIAKEKQTTVTGKFNNIFLTATPEATVNDLLVEYQVECDKAEKAYLASPAYREHLQLVQKKTDEANAKAKVLMEKFDSLNWDSVTDILDWLCEIQPVADTSGVALDRKKIVRAFVDHGFKANVNTHKNFKADDKDNVARYIIGQAMDGLEVVGAPHHVLIRFVDDWKKKFA